VCGLTHSASIAVRAATALSESRSATIAGVICGREGARLYMPQSVYGDYTKAGGTLLISLKREKSMVQQFTSLSPAGEVIKSVTSAVSYPLVQVCLGDKTLCILPTTFLGNLGIVPEKQILRLGVDRRSMREFMHMMENLRGSFTKREAEDERVLARYLYNSPATNSRSVRSIKRVLWGFDPLPGWVERVIMRENDCASADSSSIASGSSVSTRTSSGTSISGSTSPSSATSSLSSDHDSSFSVGYLASTRGIAGLALELGKEEFVHRFLKGGKLLDFSGQDLTTLDDFCQVCTNLFSGAELLSITELDLANNALTEIPIGAFSCLPALQSLMLNNNPMRTISYRALQGLEKLEKLFIADIAGLELPDDFLRCVPRLTLFFAPRCGLSGCPSLRFVPKLKTLDVAGNCLTVLPDASFLSELEVYNAMDNRIEIFDLACFPRSSDGHLTLSTLQLNDNVIAAIPSTFYHAMPQAGFLLTLHNNPLWETAQDSISRGLQEVGFEAFDEESKSHGTALAQEVSKHIFDITCDRACVYLRDKDAFTTPLIWNEIQRRRPVRAIATAKADRAKWVYDNQWWIFAGITLLTGGIGAIIGIFARKVAKSVARRAALGGVMGAVFGAVASWAGCKYFANDGHLYFDTGGAGVHMTSDLKRLYVGTYRTIALLALFKQYLAALSVSLMWLAFHDQFAEKKQMHRLMEDLENKIWAARQGLFERVDEPTTLAMLHQLTVEAPIDEIRKHTPDDLFPGSALESVNLSDGAAFSLMVHDQVVMIRAAIIRFAAAARTVRAAVINRYMGTYDHARVCRLMCELPELREALSLIVTEVVEPLKATMKFMGEESLPWYEEINRFGVVVSECNIALDTCAKHRECIDRIVR